MKGGENKGEIKLLHEGERNHIGQRKILSTSSKSCAKDGGGGLFDLIPEGKMKVCCHEVQFNIRLPNCRAAH